MPFEGFDVAPDQVDQIIQRAFLDRQRAVHIGFASGQTRIDQQSPLCCTVMQTNGDTRCGTISKIVSSAARVDQGAITLIYHRAEKSCQKHRFPRIAKTLRRRGKS